MATQLQIRRGTSAQVAAFTGAEGEVVVNTTNDSIHVNDGSTAGGFELARVDGSNWAITNAISTTANISFGDNDKAIFGVGSDLQIYHDGSHSYISDQGTGQLRILASQFQVMNAAGTESMVFGAQDNTATLYYDNAAKLATTSTGIDVTGTVTADEAKIGGTIPASPDGVLAVRSDSDAHAISIYEPAGANENWQIGVDADGDLGFYNSGSTTAAVTIDDSNNVGIGTSSPGQALSVESSSAGVTRASITNTGNAAAGAGVQLVTKNGATQVSNATLRTDNAGNFSIFSGTTTEALRMTIDSSGNLLVGTTDVDHYATSTNQGMSFRADFGGLIASTRSNNYSGVFNRIGTDGDILNFRKDGSTVGSIGVKNSDLTIGAGDTGLRFTDSTDQIWAVDTADGSSRDAAVDLGNSTVRFKDLYLSGNIYADSQVFATGIGHKSDTNTYISFPQSDRIVFTTGNSEAARFDSSGNLLVGKTSVGQAIVGCELRSDRAVVTRDGGTPLTLNRLTSDGSILDLLKDGTTVGSIGSYSGIYTYIGTDDTALLFAGNIDAVVPFSPSASNYRDNAIDIGTSSYRFNDIYATNGTIQTSDRNEKQDIEVLSDAEQRVAVAAKGLLRKFRWISSVEENGDDARIHFGIIAQDLQAAFEAEGLDAGRYAMFTSNTWTDEETGEERTRLGVRYSELLAFIIAAI